jgi:hypothetical protein
MVSAYSEEREREGELFKVGKTEKLEETHQRKAWS